jgi:hypothetical protein
MPNQAAAPATCRECRRVSLATTGGSGSVGVGGNGADGHQPDHCGAPSLANDRIELNRLIRCPELIDEAHHCHP